MKCLKLLVKGLMVLFLVLPFGCEKNDDGSYVAPITRYEKIQGYWKLTAMKQVDEIAKSNAAKPDELPLTTKFKFQSFRITFNVDSTHEVVPTTFKVEGDAPALFLTEGYWDMDTPYATTNGQPSKILLYSDAAKTVLVDKLDLITVPGTKATLEIKLVRYVGTTPFVSYLYSLKPGK